MAKRLKDAPAGGTGPWSRREFLKRSGGVALLGGGALSALAAGGSPSTSSGASKPKKGGHLTEGYIYDISTFNPVIASQRTTNQLVSWLMFDGLLAVKPDGNPKPAIATAVPTPSSGGTTYVFNLRPDVRWTDGNPVTADDVVFTYKLFFDPKYATVPSGWRAPLEAALADVSAPNPHQVVFKLKQPYAPFITNYANGGILPSHVLGAMSPQQIVNASFNNAPTVSNGMFKFSKYTPGQSATLVRNDHYYGGAPNIDAYIFKYIPDVNTISSQLQSGDIDFATIPLNTVSSFKSNSSFNVHEYVMPEILFCYMQLNPDKPASKILGDLRVRKALMYAVDKNAMVKAAFFGYAKPIVSSIIAATSWAYNPNPTPSYKYDPSLAKKLLEEAGWTTGSGGVRTKDGAPLSLSIKAYNTEPYESMAQVLQGAWAKVGVKTSIETSETSILENVAMNTRDFDIMLQENTPTADPDPTDGISSSATAPGGANAPDYRNPKVDALLQQANGTTSESARKKAYFEMQDILAADLPELPFVSMKSVYAVQKRVHNFALAPYTRFQRPWMKDVWVSSQ